MQEVSNNVTHTVAYILFSIEIIEPHFVGKFYQCWRLFHILQQVSRVAGNFLKPQ